MASPTINQYITLRYDRWLDYSRYHCNRQNIPDEAADILNEVLYMILEKDPAETQNLYNNQRGQYRELDYYILRMIKISIQSPTSAYQWKYRQVETDANIHLSDLNIADEEYTEPAAETTIHKMNRTRKIFDELPLTDQERKIFFHFFFLGEKSSTWQGSETNTILYSTYHTVKNAIRTIINQLPVEENKKREPRIVKQYYHDQQIKTTLQKLCLSEKAITIFTFKHIKGKDYTQWPGPEPKNRLKKTYTKILTLYQEKQNNQLLF